MCEELPTLNELPNEMLCAIFKHVSPYKDLDRCKLVCKRWLNLVTFVRNKRKKIAIKNILTGKMAVDVISDDENFVLQGVCRYKSDFYLLGRDRKQFVCPTRIWYANTTSIMYKFEIESKTLKKITMTGDIPFELYRINLVNYKEDLFFFTNLHLSEDINLPEDENDFPKDEIKKFVDMYSYKIESRTWVKQCLPVPFINIGEFFSIVHEDCVIFYMNQCKEIHVLNLITMSWWVPEQINPQLHSNFRYVYTESNNCYFIEDYAREIWRLKVNTTDKNEVWMWTKIVVEGRQDLKMLHDVCCSVLIDNFLICFAGLFKTRECTLKVLAIDLSKASEENKVKLNLIMPYKCPKPRNILFIEIPGVNYLVLGCPCFITADSYMN